MTLLSVLAVISLHTLNIIGLTVGKYVKKRSVLKFDKM